jgi:hypothetical protein
VAPVSSKPEPLHPLDTRMAGSPEAGATTTVLDYGMTERSIRLSETPDLSTGDAYRARWWFRSSGPPMHLDSTPVGIRPPDMTR